MQDYKIISKIIGPNLKQTIADKIIENINISSQSKILDIGCGTGGDSNYIAKKTGAMVIGVDIDDNVISHANRMIPVLKYDLCNTPLPFANQTFDGIFGLNLLQLINDKEKLFDELYRLLRPGGVLFLLMTTQTQIKERYINKYFPSLQEIELDRHIFESDLKIKLTKSKFHNIQKIEFKVDECVIDKNYLNRLKSGIMSSLLLISDEERISGLKNLEEEINANEISDNYHKYIRIRSALIISK